MYIEIINWWLVKMEYGRYQPHSHFVYIYAIQIVINYELFPYTY